MKLWKILIVVFIIAALVILFVVLKNYCLDKGVLALKENKFDNAIKYLKPIAIIGDSNAQRFVAECYAFGWSVQKSNEKAIYWFRRATKKTNCINDECIAADLYFVGEKYLNGQGVEPDKKEALYWIKKSAENGYPKAMKLLSNN